MAQLERIRAVMEQRWGSEGEDRKEESGDDVEGSEDDPEKVRRKRLYHSSPIRISGFVFLYFNRIIYFL